MHFTVLEGAASASTIGPIEKRRGERFFGGGLAVLFQNITPRWLSMASREARSRPFGPA
jgi:hypothetical protein